ncbi:two-component system, OmpR family, heavy metal sensor histidine kinase CusS [Atopomonas hussainii]|uniref:Sensor protein n=1 Tax=Atopomonas hussainii TaxID=1429083 RepID=A0A1H7KNM2_9GAMM|nr:heavy metal sensor histidine kinase [Atopomonas hussainii]SEK88134.1 two-component system, OmpR family, heavy metal sensor histidine kinase CusS [Atopomonas hussainii]
MSGKRVSLTTRMTLMFTSAVLVVLLLAGLSFSVLSQHHFKQLDQQTLNEKLDAIENMLNHPSTSQHIDTLRLRLTALLGGHQDLAAIIRNQHGEIIFSAAHALEPPRTANNNAPSLLFDWQHNNKSYRTLASLINTPTQQSLTVQLTLDITHHSDFFATLQRWLWVGLIICALLSAAIGWWVAHRGLLPLRQIAITATTISVSSLQERIPLEPIPFELQRLALAFNAMLERLEDAFGRLSNFSSDIAHELRTPINNLLTQTEVTLSKPRDNATYQDNLLSNLEDLKRMSRIIDDMLFLAKADNGLITPEHKPVALDKTVRKLFEYFSLIAEERNIQLKLNGSGTTYGDQLMLERAIANVLTNAVRYSTAQQCINVEISQRATEIQLSISNQGPTINPEHINKLFDRFYRADPARREGSTLNAGLGLAITQSILRAHGGSIRCHSQDGLTTFTLVLPLAP